MYLRKLGISAGLVTLSLAVLTSTSLFSPKSTTIPPQVPGKGSVDNLSQAYEKWREEYEVMPRSGPSIGMTWNKGLSSEHSKAKGIATINLETGEVDVRVIGMEDQAVSDIWLVDNLDAVNNTIQPDADDQFLHLGRLQFDGEDAELKTTIDVNALNDMEIDWVVLTRAGTTPDVGGVLYGSTSLFQKIYHYPQHRISHTDGRRYGQLISSANAAGITPSSYADATLINDGRDIFFNETFDGNGRTCGTCHPADNNFTLDPKFIATLPDSDPLFMAERPLPNPLSENFEKPKLMRKVGLILENTNGFDDLENSFTMRSVPHLLSMRTSVSPPTAAANDGTSNPPDERTGWSGDGAPSGMVGALDTRGTLRDFAVGAVKQHFTRSLSRTPGQDFRLPTEYELDAMEAFMLSLGRQEEFDDFTQISLADERADQGRLNYMGEGVVPGLTCNACHFNGGANTDPNFDFPASVTPAAFEMTNRSFAPRGEELLDQPGDLVDILNNPFDDGFGSGTNLFNVPVVIEAADTGPFFHNNQVDTVEAMIAFYSSQRHLRDGTVLPPLVGLNGSQVANVGAFLRVLNADENARSAIELIEKASRLRWRDRKLNLSLARAEINDAIEVLDGGKLHFDDAIPLLDQALYYAQKPWSMNRAKNKLAQVREIMIQR